MLLASTLPALAADERLPPHRLDVFAMVAKKAGISALKGGTLVLRNAYLSVRLLPSSRIVLLTRTAQAFETATEIDQCAAELARAVPRETRNGLRILLDMRSGPIRVHPALDPAFERFRRETELGFACAAVVVATPLGKLRADRLANPKAFPVRVVGSLEEALDFINGL
jgi:hypothetical protein